MCKEIKLDPELMKVPFIFLTAVTDDYKFDYAMLSGADQYIAKPIKFEFLLEIVNNVTYMIIKTHRVIY